MQEYHVYWIKEKFARHYYYKSDILFRFLKEYELKQTRSDLLAQFHYITNCFPKSLLSQFNKQEEQLILKKVSNHIYVLQQNQNYITLHMDEKQIKFRCETLQDAEALLFPVLRRFHPFLFILNHQLDNYGWISPAKISSAYNNDQVLYS